MAGFGSSFKRVDVGDLERRPHEGDGLGAHAGEAQQFEHGGLVLLQKLFAQRHRPCCDDGDDVGGHALADTGDREEPFRIGIGGRESCQLGGLLLDGLGGAAVGANAEGVGRVDFKEGGGFVEDAGDADVVHKWEPG